MAGSVPGVTTPSLFLRQAQEGCKGGDGKYQPPRVLALKDRHDAGHMFDHLCSWDNLYLAYRLAAKGKRGRAAAASFEYRLEDNLIDLQRALQEKTYQPGAYTSFYIHEPKRRLISAAPFRDRVVHHALCNVIEPLFERTFIGDSYANRVGKGTHRALNRCQQFARRYRYVLQCDIAQFFPSIDHTILRGMLARVIRNDDVLWLVDRILHSGVGVLSDEYEMAWFEGDDLLAALRSRGLPIGNLTSQFWANCYLNSLDQFVKRRLGCRGYVRYVDDFVLFGDDKATLQRWLTMLTDQLAHSRLMLHANAQAKPVGEGISFLGFVVWPQRRRLKRRKGIHFRRRFRALLARYGSGDIALDDLTASVRGWVNHACFGNTTGLRRAVLNEAIGRRRALRQ